MGDVAEPENDIDWYRAELDACRGMLASKTESLNELSEQVGRLGDCIMGLPHEPSESEGAIDCAIRLLSGGAGLIADERQRQQNREGWTPEHDDEHLAGSMAQAAISYAYYGFWQIDPHHGWTQSMVDDAILDDDEGLIGVSWPWDAGWWKPDAEDPVHNLVRAGALIAAEIDRHKRLHTNTLTIYPEPTDG